MATVHLICGQLGAGKTVRAREVAGRAGGVRFSLDEWIMGMFGSEAPEPMTLEWWSDRAGRCERRIWQLCEDLLMHGLDVVLDFGFPTRAMRDRYRQLARAVSAPVKIHVVTADRELRRERVQRRNQQRGETFALVVTGAMFDGSEGWWEPLAADELEAGES